MTNPFKMEIPNLKNRRTYKRVYNALAFVNASLSDITARPLGRDYLNKYFSQSNSVTGKWLRYHLIKEDGDAFNMWLGQCKRYTRNQEGCELIEELLEISKPYNAFSGLTMKDKHLTLDMKMAIEWAVKEFPFDKIEYEYKTYRHWHPVQSLRKLVRAEYLKRNGITEQYDLVCAAQTLLYQLYQRETGQTLDMIESYIANRDIVRQRLATEMELPIKKVKTIITALFAGARVVANPHNAIFQECYYDKSRIEWMKQDVYFNLLRDEIHEMWTALRPYVEHVKEVNSSQRILTSTNKWRLYFSLEEVIMNSIRQHLDSHNKKYFLIHDAICTEPNAIDIASLKSHIYKSTKFHINIEKSYL